MKPTVVDPKQLKKTDALGIDEDGVMHDKCGTPECCQKCDTSEDKQELLDELNPDKLPNVEDLEVYKGYFKD